MKMVKSRYRVGSGKSDYLSAREVLEGWEDRDRLLVILQGGLVM